MGLVRRTVFVALVCAVISIATPAFGRWAAETNEAGAAGARAMTVPAGATPSAAAAGTSIDVAWAPTTSPPATGYVVRAYDATSGAVRAVGSGCDGLVTGTSCTESDVPDGTWRYTVTPRVSGWSGAAGPASTDVVVEARDPSPTALLLVNGAGGSAGVVDPGEDHAVITFSEPLSVASLCSDWSNDAADQSESGPGVTVTLSDTGGTTHLAVTTMGPGRCTPHFGTVDLGADYLTSPTAIFTGSKVEWNVASRSLTVTLGALDSGTLRLSPVAPATATYTPDAAVTDRFGHPVVTTPITADGQRC